MASSAFFCNLARAFAHLRPSASWNLRASSGRLCARSPVYIKSATPSTLHVITGHPVVQTEKGSVIVRISKQPPLTQTPHSRHHGALFGRYLVSEDTTVPSPGATSHPNDITVPSPVPSPDANHLYRTLRLPLRMRAMCEPTPERPCQLGN
ncbi:BQ5605_C009g05523 [Microbotryum silenes-dioicae]|uniref:BQ5605_C009g05523 protein n=1 Tax=Microbotryum silenes-dioicae TaxID=796604 RepID=A0A2X0MGN4_9BASI|nr:BQ5605_C009g05523 [Microbotryum silenes-dioicae]